MFRGARSGTTLTRFAAPRGVAHTAGTLLFCCLFARGAAAETSLHVTGSATAAYTDNAFSAPSTPQPGQRGVVATPFFLLTPGLALFHDLSTARYELSYQHDFTFFLNSSVDNSGSDTVRSQGLFELSARDTLTLNLNATRSSFTRLLVNANGPGATEVQADGSVERLRVDLAEGYARQLNNEWRFLQVLQAGTLIPFTYDEPVRYQTGLELGLEYARPVDVYGVAIGTTYFKSLTLRDRTVTLPVTEQLVTTLNARWRHDLSSEWSTNLTAGVGVASELGGKSTPFPVAGAGLAYAGELLAATLEVNHSQFVSLESAQTYVSDTVTAAVGIPITEQRPFGFDVSSSLGHNRQLIDGGNDEAANVWLSEASVGYGPSFLTLELRAQHFEQFGGGATAVALPDLSRNVVMLTLSSMFPERERIRARETAPGESEEDEDDE